MDDSGEIDLNRIDVNNEANVHFWAKQFGISTIELKFVVKKAGPAVAAVKKLLKELNWPEKK